MVVENVLINDVKRSTGDDHCLNFVCVCASFATIIKEEICVGGVTNF